MFNWNWADFVITIIGSFLGIICAILATILANVIIDLKRTRKIVFRIRKDLKNFIMKKDYESVKCFVESGYISYNNLIELPYLEEIISSLDLSIAKKNSFSKLTELYLNITMINKLYLSRTEFFMAHFSNIDIRQDKSKYNVETKIFIDLGDEIVKSYDRFYKIAMECLDKNL